jgi:indolepyruvate ferredoxin oxidoreductase beta subunit
MNIIITGVGGQGNVLAARLLASAAMKAGYDVLVSELYGSAQRGGPVISYIKIRRGRVLAPLIMRGTAQAAISLEIGEILRRIEYIAPGALMVINDYALPSSEVLTSGAHYPTREEVYEILRPISSNVYFIPATEIAVKELGSARVANVLMLGAFIQLSKLDISDELMLETLEENIPARYIELNKRAYFKGKEIASSLIK